MYALRERRVHVTQEDFEMAVTKVILNCFTCQCISVITITTSSYEAKILVPVHVQEGKIRNIFAHFLPVHCKYSKMLKHKVILAWVPKDMRLFPLHYSLKFCFSF